jgi:hypothetical protein
MDEKKLTPISQLSEQNTNLIKAESFSWGVGLGGIAFIVSHTPLGDVVTTFTIDTLTKISRDLYKQDFEIEEQLFRSKHTH